MTEPVDRPLAPMHSWVVCWWCGAVVADLALHNTRCTPPEPEPEPTEPTPDPEPVEPAPESTEDPLG